MCEERSSTSEVRTEYEHYLWAMGVTMCQWTYVSMEVMSQSTSAKEILTPQCSLSAQIPTFGKA